MAEPANSATQRPPRGRDDRGPRDRYVDAAVSYLLGEVELAARDAGRGATGARGGAPLPGDGVRRSAESLGIRLVAQLTGTTHAAPLYYFPDRTCLVAAVAAEGFRRLLAELEQAPVGPADSGAGGRARRRGRRLPAVAEDAYRYVRWAGEHPALFTAMYDPALAPGLELLQYAGLQGESASEAFGSRHGGSARSVERRVEAFEELLAAKAGTLAFFADRVAAAVERGELRRDEPLERLTYALTSMADGLAWQRITEPQGSVHLLDQHARSCLRLLLDGVAGER